ncbi:MAG: inositol monophosphatase [Sphaerochaetaceae bacterium]|nr:inositol monophosphatase [Sphaerochaetaceae bacterium]
MDGLTTRFEFAKTLVLKAGSFLCTHLEERRFVRVKNTNDYVTQADGECESLLVGSLSSRFPEDSFLGEEGGSIEKAGSDYRWIIDPIDGTVNFMHAMPLFSISVALEFKGELVAGIVYIPYFDELFTATKDNGAFLNGKSIHVTEETDPKRSLALLVPPHRHHEWMDEYMKKFMSVILNVSDHRSLGSAAVSLCYVASGRCAMYYEYGLHIYDMAAGLVILKEAGGEYTLEEQGNEQLIISAAAKHFMPFLKEHTR